MKNADKKTNQTRMPDRADQPGGVPGNPPGYPPGYFVPYPGDSPDTEDEINLLDLLIVLLKHKLLIIGIVFLAGVFSVIYAKSLDNIYRSEATIIPRAEEKTAIPGALSALGGLGGFAGEMLGLGGGGSLDKFETVLNSRVFAAKIYEKHKDEILPVLYEKNWDAKGKKWTVDKENIPTLQDITKAVSELVKIQRDKKTSILTIQVEHTKPAYAKKMVDYYLNELSESLRSETLLDARENQKFLQRQIEQISDVLLKEKIYALLAKEIEKETFARAQDPYSFQILDPPIVPDLNKRVKPKRSQICILSVIVAFFMAIFLSFFVEYVQNTKNSADPERLEKLKKSLKFKK
ncbi:MAG: Wzz/FepE/Etk N-terminal domain-containing protein [Desulfobacterales bacterium]|nr:Wzz/FepE/Etk N-terminal domain-containing protein [Desulfobacterales bacterium]